MKRQRDMRAWSEEDQLEWYAYRSGIYSFWPEILCLLLLVVLLIVVGFLVLC